MAINPISFPQYNINSSVDPSAWQSLGNLGNVYKQSQADQLKRSTLSQLGPDAAANAKLLMQSGLPDLATMGLNLQSQAQGQQREDARFAITDQRADRSLGIQENQDRRAQETFDEDSPTGRAKKAKEANLDLNDPRVKEYILTNKFPPKAEPTFAESVEQRKQQAIAQGLVEGSPGYQSFVLTGKMPREDAQPQTATDKKLIAEADDHIISGTSAIDSLRRAKLLSPKAYTGVGAGGRGYVTSFFGESSDMGKAGIATTNLTNEVMANALSQMKSIFGGNPTEGERTILLQLQGSVNQPDRVRQDIYDRAILMAQNKLNAYQQRADELRGQTFYKPGGGASGKPKTPSFTIEP